MREKSSIALIALLIIFLAFCSAACADEPQQSLTVTLDPPEGQSNDRLRLNHETTGATRQGASQPPKQQYVARTLGTQQSTGKEITIGRVGVVSASSAEIKRGPHNRNGFTLFTCRNGSYLAIVGENGSWYGVLMVDGSTGWVQKSKVSLLDYQVVGSKTAASAIGARVVNTALKYLGIPYKWGGYSWSGLDCSGFVKAVFASNGVDLPRVAADQAQVGTPVSGNDIQPGDRLYFACKGGGIDHTGIYMGNGLFIHSSVSRGGVAVDNLTKPLYYSTLVAIRRS